MRIDKIDQPKIPARIAHDEGSHVTETPRDLETHALDGQRAIAAALRPYGLEPEGTPEVIARRARAEDVPVADEALKRRLADLGMVLAVVVKVDPGLGGLVEEGERQDLYVLKHGDKPGLERAPEKLFLGVLVRRVRQRGLMGDTQAREPLDKLLRLHGGAVIGHEHAGHTPFLHGLAQAVDEVLGGLGEIPLDVARQARAVIVDAQRHGCVPLPVGRQDLARAVVEIEMPEPADVLGLEAARLAPLPGLVDCRRAVAVLLGLVPLAHVVGMHVAQDRAVGRHGAEGLGLAYERAQVLCVQQIAPVRVGRVLRAQLLGKIGIEIDSPLVLADLPLERADGVLVAGAGLVEPVLDGRFAEADGVAGDGVRPTGLGQALDFLRELAMRRRRAEQPSDDGEAKARPCLAP
ncbi:MAG: hypothetical protein BWX70_03065 [Verrucomicrobia bacterium ADurb.Bin070]|nr:MAG: hypothetical protein BWX70_03065 [Verrucomicrobia bacterium ADurb.Bin070]